MGNIVLVLILFAAVIGVVTLVAVTAGPARGGTRHAQGAGGGMVTSGDGGGGFQDGGVGGGCDSGGGGGGSC